MVKYPVFLTYPCPGLRIMTIHSEPNTVLVELLQLKVSERKAIQIIFYFF